MMILGNTLPVFRDQIQLFKSQFQYGKQIFNLDYRKRHLLVGCIGNSCPNQLLPQSFDSLDVAIFQITVETTVSL